MTNFSFVRSSALPSSNVSTASPTDTLVGVEGEASTKQFPLELIAQLVGWASVRADIAELKAVPSPRNGCIIHVLDGGDGLRRLYEFNSASTEADDGSTIIQPNAGAGRWLELEIRGTSDFSRIATSPLTGEVLVDPLTGNVVVLPIGA